MIGSRHLNFLKAMIPGLFLFFSAAALLGGILLWKRQVIKRNRRSPLTQKLLRSPGEMLRARILELDFEIDSTAFMFIVMPFLIYSVFSSQLYFDNQSISILSVSINVTMIIIIGVFLIRKITCALDKRRRLVLGLEGELVTGEELNRLMLHGCRVFHDLPTDYGNIDHVVISPSGVYSVETKMIGKLREGGSSSITVDHRTGTVKFADRIWKMPTQQLETNARWLSNHLTKAVGRSIKVNSMLALPGYYIEDRIGCSKVYVFNPKAPKRFFLHKWTTYSPEQIQQIAHQVEQLCRDVEPSFGYEKKASLLP